MFSFENDFLFPDVLTWDVITFFGKHIRCHHILYARARTHTHTHIHTHTHTHIHTYTHTSLDVITFFGKILKRIKKKGIEKIEKNRKKIEKEGCLVCLIRSSENISKGIKKLLHPAPWTCVYELPVCVGRRATARKKRKQSLVARTTVREHILQWENTFCIWRSTTCVRHCAQACLSLALAASRPMHVWICPCARSLHTHHNAALNVLRSTLRASLFSW